MAMREFHGRQIFIDDNRKTVAGYNLFSSAEVELARRERNHYNLVFSQPIYFLLVRSKVIEPKQHSKRKRGCVIVYFVSPSESNWFLLAKHEKSLRTSERNTSCVKFSFLDHRSL